MHISSYVTFHVYTFLCHILVRYLVFISSYVMFHVYTFKKQKIQVLLNNVGCRYQRTKNEVLLSHSIQHFKAQISTHWLYPLFPLGHCLSMAWSPLACCLPWVSLSCLFLTERIWLHFSFLPPNTYMSTFIHAYTKYTWACIYVRTHIPSWNCNSQKDSKSQQRKILPLSRYALLHNVGKGIIHMFFLLLVFSSSPHIPLTF